MSCVKTNKNFLFSLAIICLLGIFQAFQTYSYKDYDSHYIAEDILGAVFGRLFLWTFIPLLIASIAKFALKKQFGRTLLKSIILISVPFALIGSYGYYSEHASNTKPSMSNLDTRAYKYKRVKRFLELSNVPHLMTNQVNLLIFEGDKKARSANPDMPDYIFEGMNQKLNSVMQVLIWEKNGLMDQFVQIYSNHLTDKQVEKLVRFYENPLWLKINSKKPLTEAERKAYNELYSYTFDKDITSSTEQIVKESEVVSKEWLKYALPKGNIEMEEYLKSLGYTLDGYILHKIE